MYELDPSCLPWERGESEGGFPDNHKVAIEHRQF
jgi:hypothetical protein